MTNMTTTRQDGAPDLDEAALRQRLEALASFPALGRDSVERFGDALRSLGAWDRLRMNPYRFAAAHGMPEAEAVELFVHGAKVGLFDFVWNHICPSCGALIGSHDSVNSLTALR